jgi:hypothetical protein
MDPVTVMILDEETSQARIGSAAAAFFRSVSTIARRVGSPARRRAPAGNTRGPSPHACGLSNENPRRVIQATTASLDDVK